MTVTKQNRLLIFERRVLRKIYRPTQDNDGTWRIKTNEELEILIKKKSIIRFIKSQRMGTMFIKTSRKNKTEMAQTSRRKFKEDESEKLETEV